MSTKRFGTGNYEKIWGVLKKNQTGGQAKIWGGH